MPKYLLKQVGNDEDFTFERVGEAWIDGYRIAGRQLEGHPIKITQAPDFSFSAALNLPSWMRLSGRTLRQDVIDYVSAGADGMSSTEALDTDDCLVYDTDRPSAQNDPVLVDANGAHTTLVPTTPRPQPKAAPTGNPDGIADPQTQAIMTGKGYSPLPVGQAAVAAMAGQPEFQKLEAALQADPDHPMLAMNSPRQIVSQVVMKSNLIPTEETGLDALIEHLGIDEDHDPQGGLAQGLATQLGQLVNHPNVGQVVGVAPSTTPPAPSGPQGVVPKKIQTTNLAQALANLPGFAPGAKPAAAQATAQAFSGASWLYAILEDDEMTEEGLTALVIAPAAEWRATGAMPSEEISEMIGDDLPDSLFEDRPGYFLSEEAPDDLRKTLAATGVFQEDNAIAP